ncbi:MAG: hypothetical protein LBL66_00470 [Clostridiales bacterium]|nr:hypothetical protein [Clostridiales bacterium]
MRKKISELLFPVGAVCLAVGQIIEKAASGLPVGLSAFLCGLGAGLVLVGISRVIIKRGQKSA